MKSIHFTTDAKHRLTRYLSPNKRILLDFSDGVGPFSAIGSCSLDGNYRLIFINKDVSTPDFDERVISNIGDIKIKSESDAQFDNQMEVRFNSHYFTLPLVSSKSTLTENLEVVDLSSDNENTIKQPDNAADC